MHNYGLIADIGGTNARFATVDKSGNIANIKKLAVDKYDNFNNALIDYISSLSSDIVIKDAYVDVACPVMSDNIEFTNSHWTFSISEIKKNMNWQSFNVVNDFAAVGLALPHLSKDELEVIGTKCEPDINMPKIAIGPGTGLGVTITAKNKDSNNWVLIPSEGGHSSIAPMNKLEDEIINYLRKSLNTHISAERVASGHGLENVYEALWHINNENSEPFSRVSAPKIGEMALDGDKLAKEAVMQMFSFLGSFVGSINLILLAKGGIYIAGGIIPKLKTLFDESNFRVAFEAKGRYSSINKETPTYLIKNEYPAFLGLSKAIQKIMSKNH